MAGVSHVYAGAVRSMEVARGGVFRHAAGEERWQALDGGLPDGTEVHAVTVDPDEDGGESWSEHPLPDGVGDCYAIACG
jgi:hypothetical protein